LILGNPPKEAIEARQGQANRAVHGDDDNDHYHTVANPAKGEKPGQRGTGPPKPMGYRPDRKGARRQDRRPKHKGGDSGART
jgi:hypothetical protein